MATIYQHWVGTMLVEAASLPAARHGVDEWIPEEKPAGAQLLCTDEIPNSVDVFDNVIVLKGRVGPIKLNITTDIAFTGLIEYWRAE